MSTLLLAAVWSDDSPNVILVDDSKPILSAGLTVLEEVNTKCHDHGLYKAAGGMGHGRLRVHC